MNYGPRAYFAQTCAQSFAPNIFTPLYLLDKTISFTVNLQAVGCACNAAFYLVSMPAVNSNQQYDPTTCGDYYCDANHVCGINCPEIDLMEANNAAFQFTPHNCAAPSGGYYPSCDGGGCGVNAAHQSPSSYMWGSSVIDTSQPFRFNATFKTANGQLDSVTAVLDQNGRTYQLNSPCNSGYLNSLTAPMQKGMVVAISYWGDTGSTMSWLDVPPCDINTSCDKGGWFTVSNVNIF